MAALRAVHWLSRAQRELNKARFNTNDEHRARESKAQQHFMSPSCWRQTYLNRKQKKPPLASSTSEGEQTKVLWEGTSKNASKTKAQSNGKESKTYAHPPHSKSLDTQFKLQKVCTDMLITPLGHYMYHTAEHQYYRGSSPARTINESLQLLCASRGQRGYSVTN